jgi:hypothetical protein
MNGGILALCCLLLAFLPFPATAHDIPAETIVRMFVKPEGQSLRVLARMPLKALPDAEYPRKERDFVDLAKAEPFLRDAAKLGIIDNLKIYEDGRELPAPRIAGARVSLESDGSFASYERALAHILGAKLPPSQTLYWEQGLVDVELVYPIRSPQSRFSLAGDFDRLGLKEVTILQFLHPSGAIRAYQLEGDAGLVEMEPGWWNAARRFVAMGFHHILDGTDHLLFLFCLVIPFRRLGPLVAIVTAFTIAHSITLVAAAYRYAPEALWFPPLIEVLIAASIFYMALENIVVAQPARRWILTFCFGLVHGFGFSFALQHSLQFAGAHLLTALLSFNIGVELGQLLVLCLAVPALHLLFRQVVAERVGIIILSAIAAHQAWHWLTERLGLLSQFPWPRITREGLVSLLNWLMAAVVLAALVWLTSLALSRWLPKVREALSGGGK